MAGNDFFPFALTERGNLSPRDLPPRGGLHGSKLPVGRIDDGQTALRVAHPPEMLGRNFFCC